MTTLHEYDAASDQSSLRSTVFRVLETAQEDDHPSRFVDIFLIVLIAASVLAVVLESVPSFAARSTER